MPIQNRKLLLCLPGLSKSKTVAVCPHAVGPRGSVLCDGHLPVSGLHPATQLRLARPGPVRRHHDHHASALLCGMDCAPQVSLGALIISQSDADIVLHLCLL